MCSLTIENLMDIWERTLGNPPSRAQFELWAATNMAQVIKESILATAKKNLIMGATMSQEHRIRHASGVMNTRTRRSETNAENRTALANEMERSENNSNETRACEK